jgi:phosphatidate cytidylyltransferase
MKVILLALFVLFSVLLGATGTVIANRKKDKKTRQKRWLKAGVFFIIVAGIICCMLYFPSGLIFLSVLITLAGFLELFSVWRSSSSHLSPVFYIAVFLFFGWISFSFLQMILSFSPNLSLLIFLTVFSFDAFSQVSGQVFGKHPLFPKTSPRKTYEGLAGGILAALTTCLLLSRIFLAHRGWPEALLLGLLIATTALYGDYLASRYKRLHNVKDFSRLLPGQGGFLDRFDSWLFSGAVLYWLKKLLLPLMEG